MRAAVSVFVAVLLAPILLGAAPSLTDATPFSVVANRDATLNSNEPTQPFGDAPELVIGTDPAIDGARYRSIIGFDLSGLQGHVASARLRLFAVEGEPAGIEIATTSGDWREDAVTWASAPETETAIGSLSGSAITSGWFDVKLDPDAILPGRELSVVVGTALGRVVRLANRESKTPPQLQIQLTSVTVASATASPSASSGPAASPSSAPTSSPGTASPSPVATATPSSSSPPAPTSAPTATVPSPTAAATSSPSPSPTSSGSPGATPPPSSPASGFVGRSGTSLILDGAAVRLVGINNPMGARGLASNDEFAREMNEVAGLDVTRVWTNQAHGTVNGARSWTNIDAMLAAAEAHGVKVVMVLSDEWNGQVTRDQTGRLTLPWFQSGYRTTTMANDIVPYRDWVREIATRYRDRPGIAMWQLGNELSAEESDGSCPSPASARDALRAFADDVAGVIKAADPNHLVSLGTVQGQCGSQDSYYSYIHAGTIDVLDNHDYSGTAAMGGDQYNGQAVAIDRANALGKPIIIGESGIDWIAGGITRDERKTYFQQKIAAHFDRGADAFLFWTWGGYTWNNTWGEEIPFGDPTLDLLPQH